MIKPIIINNWKCYTTPYTKRRIAENLSTKQEVQYDTQKEEFNFTFLEVESKIPEVVFLWLLKPKMFEAWEEARLFQAQQDGRGYDKIEEENPYKE